MEQPTYRNASHEERLALARRSGQLLMLIAGRLKDNDPMAAAIYSNRLVTEVIEGKHI